MIRFRSPTSLALRAPLEGQSVASVTYAEQGATASELPIKFTHDELSIVIGSSRSLFEACGDHLDSWGLQRSMGFVVFPDDSRVSERQTILLLLPIFRTTFVASCRVIYTVRENNRRGFAYGTLPMHPECGEEYFGVRIDEDDAVHFEIRAFSKPHSRLARLGGPVTRRLQLRALHRYGFEMQAFADQFQGPS